MRGEVLVAIVNNQLDYAILREKNWYRIPVSSAQKWLKDRWPPKWLAFYQTKVFGPEAHAIHYYARVLRIREVFRWELFPNEPREGKNLTRYYQLLLEPLRRLPKPILSRRARRIVFIPTTLDKFTQAVEINDLFDESNLEDQLWAEFKRLQISAERQLFIQIKENNYVLDFAIFCAQGNIDVETDGDVWHANPERAPQDNLRDNALDTVGWRVLRFSTRQIQEQLAGYCLPTIVENVNRLGGITEGQFGVRRIELSGNSAYQPSLFDDLD